MYKEQQYIAFYKSVFHGFTHVFILIYFNIFCFFIYIYYYILNLLFLIIKFQKLHQKWRKLHSSCNNC